ncbi:MAG: NAD(P)/FAD-dependent oxidoreductase [Rhodospirillales bacterium]
MAERLECAVVGAGVVGLAVARALAAAGREVVVIEAADAIGTATSSRNSEVIHAGLYYPPGSLKARLCRRGRDLLYRYLGAHGVDHRRCGKLVVATRETELAALAALETRARANGVDDVRRLSGGEARALEPALDCVAALASPSTGILDSHGYMLSLRGEAEDHGAAISFLSPVTGGRCGADGIVLEVGGRDPVALACRVVVNCAGLGAQDLARGLRGVPPATIPPLHYAKGSYFRLSGRAPFGRLIYPVPGPASLGIHYTRDLAGEGKFGPDVEWVDTLDYRVDPGRAAAFRTAIRAYWPGLPDDSLQPGYAGIRPKIQAPGDPAADFVIQGREQHGVDGLVNLFGIESPGLTASLAIAEAVLDRLGGR